MQFKRGYFKKSRKNLIFVVLCKSLEKTGNLGIYSRREDTKKLEAQMLSWAICLFLRLHNVC